LIKTKYYVHDGFVVWVLFGFSVDSLDMFVESILSDEDILELCGHAGTDLAIEM
jgi:hypothetical protein